MNLGKKAPLFSASNRSAKFLGLRENLRMTCIYSVLSLTSGVEDLMTSIGNRRIQPGSFAHVNLSWRVTLGAIV